LNANRIFVMRRLLLPILLLALGVSPALAQTEGAAPPVPDVRPPAMAPLDDTLEPAVTIEKRGGNTVEEYRLNGRLYKIVVTPDGGIPYTLVDKTGDGNFSAENAPPGSPGVSVPMWVIGTF
jgi:hypothetical protein